jgi:hypothetical protein
MNDKKFKYDGRSRPATDLYKENFNRIFNPTLTKNMPNVKWDQLPPRKGPNPQGRIYGNNKKYGSTISRKVLPNKRND